MDHNAFKSHLQRRAEQMAPTSEVNLWPAIRARLSSPHAVLPISPGGFKMKPSSRAIPILAGIALALILALAFFATTPQGQALAQQFISLFFRTAPDVRPFPPEDASPVPITPAASPAAITPAVASSATVTPVADSPDVTPIADSSAGESLPGWQIFKPSWLPEGVGAIGAIEYHSKSGVVLQEYGFLKTIGMSAGFFFLDQRKTPFTDLWPVGESAHIETIQIGDVPGEYVIGAWGGATDHLEWEANPNIQHLRWKANGYYFNIDFIAMSINPEDLATSPYYLSKEKLIAIASSLK
jgi:hypothetical protein